jgi:hypothetical protein
MGGITCSNPNSCHPLLFTFGLITVALMAFYLIRDTLFDNARRKKGPILSTFNTAKPRQPPVGGELIPGQGAVRATDGGADGFKALRYEDTKYGNNERQERGNSDGTSKDSTRPTVDVEKPSHPPMSEEADLGCRPATFAIDSPKYEDKWQGNVQHLEERRGEKMSGGLVFPDTRDRRSKQSDLEFRLASFGGKEPDMEFNPYKWYENFGGLKKGSDPRESHQKA